VTAPVMLNVAAVLAIATVPPTVVVSNELTQGLHFTWEVEKSNSPQSDQARIAITNLGAIGRKALMAAAALPFPIQVQLSVGWGVMPELLFMGEAWTIRPEIKHGTEIVTELEVGDGVGPTRDTPPGGGAMVGQLVSAAVLIAVAQMRLVPSPGAVLAVQEAAAALPPIAFLSVGDKAPRETLDDLMATLGLGWGVENNTTFVAYRAGLRNDLPPSVLTPLSGLLRADVLDDGGVQFEALAQARVVPGLQVSILVPGPGGNVTTMIPIGGGPLRVESVRFSGSTEGPSLMSGIARKVAIL
jgi:hypothetical protein